MISFITIAQSSFFSKSVSFKYSSTPSVSHPPINYAYQICARKGGSKKRPKKNTSKETSPSDSLPITAKVESQPTDTSLDQTESIPYIESIEDDVEDEAEEEIQEEFPVSNESKLRLPDRKNATSRQSRKERLRRKAAKRKEKDIISPLETKESMSTESIQKLTRAYRKGGEEAQELISKIEKDPDFMFQTGNPTGEYDLTSAIIGSGRPNKEGVYILPYLQSGHFLLLGIISLAAFVYYPGFPLTETSEVVRENLKKGLTLVTIFNSILAVFAFKSAKERGQPSFFWALKTLFLGNLAFNELRTNAPLENEVRRKRFKNKKTKREDEN